VILFGSGGKLVEVYRDQSLGLPPLNSTLARRLMERTRVFTALQGVRGQLPIDLAALEQLLVRFSQLVIEQHWIKEIDINPLLASPERLLALDARVVLHGLEVEKEQLPQPAIRPYPMQYVQPATLKGGTTVIIRPIRPEDEPLVVKLHETLSEETVYYRWLDALNLSQRIAHERLTRICFIDYDREMALVAEYIYPQTGQKQIIGVGRLSKILGTHDAEFSLLISDQFQRQHLGTELLSHLIQVGRDEKLQRIIGDILPENWGMLEVARQGGFSTHDSIEGRMMQAVLVL
jgi:acetyltransferase